MSPVRTSSTAPAGVPRAARHAAAFVALALVAGLLLRAAPSPACTGATGGLARRSQPTLRAVPLTPGGLPVAAPAAIGSEPTLVILCRFSDQDSTTARTAGSAPSRPSTCVSSAITTSLKALCTCGRFSVSVATPR
jgi:hypothetical protein